MRLTRFLSAADTSVALRRRRFRFRSFFVRMWLLKARMRLSFPVLLLLIRLAAPRCVFIFGIDLSPFFPGVQAQGPVFSYLVFTGATTIDMTRPSIFGCDSTLPSSPRSSITRDSTCRPISGWVTCRPRNIMVSLTLFPSSRKRQLHLLDLDRVLLFPRFAVGSSLFVLVLSVVHHLDHGRPGLRSNFYQIHPTIAGPLPGLVDGDDADLLAIVLNEPHRADPNLIVNADAVSADLYLPPMES